MHTQYWHTMYSHSLYDMLWLWFVEPGL